MAPTRPRIALLGLHHEGSRFAPPLTRDDTAEWSRLDGEALLADARSAAPRSLGTLWGFVRAMDAGGPWEPVPGVYLDAGAAGALEHGWYTEVREAMRAALEAAMPLDGVYFAQHGASITTRELDPDGELYAMARAIVGPDVPILSTLDLHAKVSERMVASTDLLCAYLTNPHVDQAERGAECARALRAMLAGTRTAKAFIRLPLVAPQVTQLTAAGPYADAIRRGQARLDEAVMNVSICGGFTYGDTPSNGMAFVVTTRADAAKARRVCRDLAAATWAERHRFVPRLTTLEDCVAEAVAVGDDPSLPALCIADVADNPGGGARGNTTWLLAALHRAGAKGVILGVFTDPPLVAEAHRQGEGATFEARFNRAERDPRSEPFAARATVRRLADGVFPGDPEGSAAGMTVDLGPTAVLDLGTVTVVAISRRQQILDPGYFERFGVDVAGARTVVVKSRGHFRAGFARHFKPARIREADVPGLTSPNLARFAFQGIPRPFFPLDPDTAWTPPADW